MVHERVQVAVVGVGGAGVNAVSRLLDLDLGGIAFVAMDTSAQTLARVPGARQVSLSGVTRGLGTGGQARLGAAAVLGAEREVLLAVRGAEVVLVVAGLAGGTGGGAGPEVARLARRGGAVVVGCGIRPFGFEAAARHRAADRAERALRLAADTTIMLDNDRALALTAGRVSLDVALRVADDVLRQALQGLGGLVGGGGWIAIDLAHVRGLLTSAGEACLALGLGRGAAAAQTAMSAALANPLADMSALQRARAVLVQVTGGPDLVIADTAAAVGLLQDRLGPGCDLVVGAGCDASLGGAAQVMVLGAGVEAAHAEPIPWPWPAYGVTVSGPTAATVSVARMSG